ncbi:MAG: YecA family protein [Betaproteobacteria bacterium]
MTAPETTSQPLTDAEITHLESLLASPPFIKQSMGLDEIQGFVCAVLSGPEPVAPEQWLPAVLGNPDYENESQAQEIKALLLRFHAEIAADLRKGESLGLVLNFDAEPTANDAEGEYDYGAWCQAYIDGVEFSSVPWVEAGEDEEIDDLLFPISLLAGEIDPKALKQIKPKEMADLLRECREDLPMLAVDIYKYFQSLRDRPKVTSRNPGSAQSDPGKKNLH